MPSKVLGFNAVWLTGRTGRCPQPATGDVGLIMSSTWAPEIHGIRVSPNLYTRVEELDQFRDAVEQVAAKGLPGWHLYARVNIFAVVPGVCAGAD
jgi:hypothetical protein